MGNRALGRPRKGPGSLDFAESVTYLFVPSNFHRMSQGCSRGRQITAPNVTMWPLVIAPRITWLATQETGSLLPDRLRKEFDQMDNVSPAGGTQIRILLSISIKLSDYFYIVISCTIHRLFYDFTNEPCIRDKVYCYTSTPVTE